MPVKKYQEFIPHVTLQDSVKRFWILEKEYDGKDSIEEVLPDACTELILNFGKPYTRATDSGARELPNVCLIGLLNKPLKLRARGLVKIVAVRFFAWGALSFLQHDWQSDSAMKVELDSAWSEMVSKLAGKVRAGEYQRAVEEIEDFLIGKRLHTLFSQIQPHDSKSLDVQ